MNNYHSSAEMCMNTHERYNSQHNIDATQLQRQHSTVSYQTKWGERLHDPTPKTL